MLSIPAIIRKCKLMDGLEGIVLRREGTDAYIIIDSELCRRQAQLVLDKCLQKLESGG